MKHFFLWVWPQSDMNLEGELILQPGSPKEKWSAETIGFGVVRIAYGAHTCGSGEPGSFHRLPHKEDVHGQNEMVLKFRDLPGSGLQRLRPGPL